MLFSFVYMKAAIKEKQERPKKAHRTTFRTRVETETYEDWLEFAKKGRLTMTGIVELLLTQFSSLKHEHPAKLAAILTDLLNGDTRLLVRAGSNGAQVLAAEDIDKMYSRGERKPVFDSKQPVLLFDWPIESDDY